MMHAMKALTKHSTTLSAKHLHASLPVFHRSLIEIVSAFNGPERDKALLEAAGLSLEQALFPLLILIGKLGPIGVVDLAGRVGRDYTTVSRQVSRLEQLGLVNRSANVNDARTREAIATPQGKQVTEAVDVAREQMFQALFRGWSQQEFDDLLRSVRKLAEGLQKKPLIEG